MALASHALWGRISAANRMITGAARRSASWESVTSWMPTTARDRHAPTHGASVDALLASRGSRCSGSDNVGVRQLRSDTEPLAAGPDLCQVTADVERLVVQRRSWKPPGSFGFPLRADMTNPAVAREIAADVCELPVAPPRRNIPLPERCGNNIQSSVQHHHR